MGAVDVIPLMKSMQLELKRRKVDDAKLLVVDAELSDSRHETVTNQRDQYLR